MSDEERAEIDQATALDRRVRARVVHLGLPRIRQEAGAKVRVCLRRLAENHAVEWVTVNPRVRGRRGVGLRTCGPGRLSALSSWADGQGTM
ncbi:hypothetical protein [Streptomyces sp. NPDC058683]|uniref:hypothetical protein n=1 Tax=Streptomyces sp. NPDC058683 TaxID=3346597 RepID=UPI00365F1980